MRARARAAQAMHSLLSLRPPTARVVAGRRGRGRGAGRAGESSRRRPRPGPAGRGDPPRRHRGLGMVVGRRVDAHRRAAAGRSRARERGDRGDPQRERRLGRRVGSVADESVLARLQRLVEDAQRDKAPLQRIADRISSVFVPAVLVGAVVTFFIWWLVVGDPGRAVLAASPSCWWPARARWAWPRRSP